MEFGKLPGDKVRSKQTKAQKAPFQMEVIYTQAVLSDQERFDFVMRIYASWLTRTILHRPSQGENTSHSEANPEQIALTSPPVDCTVGTLSSCKTGGHNK